MALIPQESSSPCGSMPQTEASLLPSASWTLLRTAHEPSSQSQRTRAAIENRSERARAILSSHKPLVLSRHKSEPNIAHLPQEASSACGSTNHTHSLSSDGSVDDETSDCPHRDNSPENHFAQGIVGDKMTQRIATKFELLEKALQQDPSAQDKFTQACDGNDLQGDMAVWMAICRKRESPGELTVMVKTEPKKSSLMEMVERRTRRPSTILFEERIKADLVKPKSHSLQAQLLPPPLTQAELNEAYKQLTPGAEKSIKSVIQWWRTNKISANDVLATVKSFSSSSVVLQEIFAAATPDPDTAGPRHGRGAIPSIKSGVASGEQMRELWLMHRDT